MKKTPPMMPHPGGKTRMLPVLLPLIAARRHTCYVEVFGGGAALLLAKPRSPVEVYNDADGELANAFRQVRFHHEAVIAELQWRINSREDFIRSKGGSVTEIQRAADFLFRKALSFGGDGQSFGVVKKQVGGASTHLGRLGDRVAAVAARLAGVVVEGLDWQRLVRLYDTPETLFFCDPPYATGKVNAYAMWSREQMHELAGTMRAIKGACVITTDDSPATREAFAGWKVQEHCHGATIVGNRTGKKMPQLLLTRGDLRE